MDPTNLAGWLVTALLVAGALLRWATDWLNQATRGMRMPRREATDVPQQGKYILTLAGGLVGALGIVGALWFPHPGVWGPVVLVFSVIWDVNARWYVRKVTWTAPVETGLDWGSKLVLLGGALGTLIAYVVSIA